MRVKDLMSRQVLAIGTSDSCLEAVARMHRARIRHLPVVNRSHWGALAPVRPETGRVRAAK